MRSSTASSQNNGKGKYFNPITKIQTLIQNLDTELVELCNQCTVSRVRVSHHEHKPHVKSNSPVKSNTTAKIIRANTNTSVFSGIKPGPSLSSQRIRRLDSTNASSSTAPSYGATLIKNYSTNNQTVVQQRTMASAYRSRVIEAYRNRRIFTVYGNYHTVRRALLRRGWLEKLAPGRLAKLQSLSEDVLMQHAKKGNDFEAVVISRIINHFPAFFIWQPKGLRDQYADVLPHRNRVRRSHCMDFTTKVGLIGCAEQEPWFRQESFSGMHHPRFYRTNVEDRQSFMEDFRQTQCRCLLRYIADHANNLQELADENGTVPTASILFAQLQCQKQLNEWNHGELDQADNCQSIEEIADWQSFYYTSNLILQKGEKFKCATAEMTQFAKDCRQILLSLEQKRPDYRWDGTRNLWILKPGYQCRGIGIIIRNSMDEILDWVNTNAHRRYIVQKYIERPLLIYNTKFDIRAYMLLSIDVEAASIWLYDDCYLRFSSQEFSMDDLRESIHLTNNSVQKRYKAKPNRDARLPKSNMWSLDQFKVYLKQKREPDDLWLTKIYAGLKENLIAVVLASLDDTDFVENSFELYGCDFMLDEQYTPILIEINSTPDLTPSTEVTARICPMVLKDVIKVVIDHAEDVRAETGQFNCVHRVPYKFKKEFDPTVGLELVGNTVPLHRPIKPITLRSKMMRKPFKMMKKVENKFKGPIFQKFKPRTNETMKKSKWNIVQMDLSAHATPMQLKSFAREALALQYTRPK